MRFEGLIITGTSCSGKSTIVNNLCMNGYENVSFEQVRAVTTRDPRPEDSHYDYITDEEFERLSNEDLLLVNTTYRRKRYGIKKESYHAVINNMNIPIMILTPCSSSILISSNPDKFLCFFVDADDDILVDRWTERSGNDMGIKEKRSFLNQSMLDRNYQDHAHYILQNSTISESVSLILFLWDSQYRGGALSQGIIKNMISCGMLLRDANLDMIHGASYDLCLGDEYYYGGKIQKLSSRNPFLTIEPYDYAIVSCKETAWIPRDIIGKFGLSVGLFCQGIILSNGPQIDPGFRGTLFCLLFNTSNRAVHLKRGKHYATIEFNKLMGYAQMYSGKYQGKNRIIDYIPENALHGAINELKKEVEKLKTEIRFMQNIYLGVVAIMFAIVSILLVIK